MNKFCKIFVSRYGSEDLLKSLLSNILNVKFNKREAIADFGEISIIRNSDFDEKLANDFPDGFLFFPLIIEVDFNKSIELSICIDVIDKITSTCWGTNIAAIVSCDFEHLLNKNGGYKIKDVPWHFSGSSGNGW